MSRSPHDQIWVKMQFWIHNSHSEVHSAPVKACIITTRIRVLHDSSLDPKYFQQNGYTHAGVHIVSDLLLYTRQRAACSSGICHITRLLHFRAQVGWPSRYCKSGIFYGHFCLCFQHKTHSASFNVCCFRLHQNKKEWGWKLIVLIFFHAHIWAFWRGCCCFA